jgi:drug/metabolite transporter (DMT)-like permease
MKHPRALAYLAFATICLVWGTTYLAIRIALETIPPLLLTGTRFVVAGSIMLIVARLRGEALPRDRRTLVNIAIVGILLVSVGNFSVIWAEQWVPSGLAALLVATAPFWMAIIEGFRAHGERVNTRGVIGMLIGFAGVAMLVTPRGSGGAWSVKFVIGALAIQVGSFCWQLGSARGKYNLQHVPLLASSALQMLFGGLVIGTLGLAFGEASRYTLNSRTFAALAYLTVAGSIIGYSAYLYALKHLRTTHTSLYAYVNPVVAVFLGWLILNEPLTWLSIVAMITILAGVAIVQTSGRTKAPKLVPAEDVAQKAA